MWSNEESEVSVMVDFLEGIWGVAKSVEYRAPVWNCLISYCKYISYCDLNKQEKTIMRTEESLHKVLFPSFGQKTKNPNYTNFWPRILECVEYWVGGKSILF